MFYRKSTGHENPSDTNIRDLQLTYTNSNSYVGDGGDENGQHGSSGDGILGIL